MTAVLTDLPVLVALAAAWLTVPVFWAHVVTGLALIAIVGMHLSTRRRLPFHPARPWRAFAYAVFLIAAAATVVTGLLRWAGVPPQQVWHGGVSYLLAGFALLHVWSVRRALRARIGMRHRANYTQRDRSV